MILLDDDIDNGLEIGDTVYHLKSGIKGVIENFEHSGGRRALIKSASKKNGWYLFLVDELELTYSDEDIIEVANIMIKENNKPNDGKLEITKVE